MADQTQTNAEYEYYEYYGVSIGCTDLVYCGKHDTYEEAKDYVEDIFTPQGDVIECLMALSDWHNVFQQFEARGIDFPLKSV